MRIFDEFGKTLLLSGFGGTSFADGSNLILAPVNAAPALQFRTGTTAFGQLVGLTDNSGMNCDYTGGIWKWRSSLGSDSGLVMKLDGTALTVTGKITTGSAVLEPFTATQLSTNGVQMLFGNSGGLRSTFGTRYSGGNTFVGHNARQTATLVDNWEQTLQTNWDSLGLFLSGSTTNGQGGFQVKRAMSGTSGNTYGNFWKDLFTVSLTGNIESYSQPLTGPFTQTLMMTLNAGGMSLYGGTLYLGHADSNLLRFNNIGAAPPMFATRSAGTKVVLYSFVSGNSVDYALGLDDATLWQSVPQNTSAFRFRWYGGTTSWMSLSAGVLDVSGGVKVNGSAIVSVPVGGIVPWLKTLTGTPSMPVEFVEANGQTIADSGSPYNGVTIPNLNGVSGGAKRFLRGSSTSGATGGNANHSHSVTVTTSSVSVSGGSTQIVTGVATPTAFEDATPAYYEVVYLMRIK